MSGLSSFRRRLMVGAYPKEQPNYLCFTALEGSTIAISHQGTLAISLQYSLDGRTWSTFNYNTTISLATGESAYIRGVNEAMAYNDTSYNSFVMTGRIEASGNVMSLLFGKNLKNALTISNRYCFCRLFYNCTSLVTPPELPATTFNNIGTYYKMFYGCTSLTSAPELPALTLQQNSYYLMFYGCTSLTSAPTIHATTVGQSSCREMFSGCTGLVSAGDIKATTLASECFNSMFYECTNLVSVGAMSATTMANMCCYKMFQRCFKLIATPSMTINNTAESCCLSMFEDCSALATNKIKFNATTLANNCYQRMFRFAPITTDVELPALTLMPTCYRQMLQGAKVTWIKMLATDISASDCLTNWVLSVPASGIFVKHINAEWTTTGNSGVPTNWKVIYYDPALDKYYLDQQRSQECDDHGNPI